MGEFQDLKAVVEDRLRAAHAIATGVAPDVELILGFRNDQDFAIDPAKRYLRGYHRSVSRRLSAGETTLQQTTGWIFVQLLMRKEEGDDEVEELADAMRAAFTTSGTDRMEFEEAAELTPGRLDGSHWLALATYPFKRHIPMPTAP